jgi:hypothetical protein
VTISPRPKTGLMERLALAIPRVESPLLDPELLFRNRRDLVQEQIPRPLGIRVELPGALDDVRYIGLRGCEVEREIENPTLAALEEPLDQSLGRGRLPYLAGASEGMHTSQPHLNCVESGRIIPAGIFADDQGTELHIVNNADDPASLPLEGEALLNHLTGDPSAEISLVVDPTGSNSATHSAMLIDELADDVRAAIALPRRP